MAEPRELPNHTSSTEANGASEDVRPSEIKEQHVDLKQTHAGESRPKSWIGICPACAQLDVRVDKFCIHGPLVKQNRWPGKSKAHSQLKTSSNKLCLGTLQEIKDRTHCPICSLVWRSTTTTEEPHLDIPDSDFKSVRCYANWEVDGREVMLDICGRISAHRNLTRRIHLQWDTNKIQDSYLVYVTPSSYRHVRPNSDAHRSWGKEHLFLGRELEAMGKNQALINSWLESCDQQHGERCAIGHSRRFVELIGKSYFGVIDVQDMRLTSLPLGAKFIALSYVWGLNRRFRTLLDNVLLHRNHGGLETHMEDLPLTIKDAMEVCRKVGIRYLWVDSLCETATEAELALFADSL